MKRRLRSAMLALFIGMILLSSMPSDLLGAVDPEKAADYFRQVAELVIKGDGSKIYSMMTPEVQANFSKKRVQDFLKATLSGLEKPKGATLNGFQILPGGEYCKVSGQLEFEKDTISLILTLKVSENGFQIHHLNLYFPKGTELYYKYGQESQRFLKDQFFPTLKANGVEGAIALVDEKVRAKVGDEMIKAVLEPLRHVTIQKIKTYSIDNTTEGKTHQFILLGDYRESLCEVEILLAERGDDFKVLDVNIKDVADN